FSLTTLAGLYFFCQGFYLSRLEIARYSECSKLPVSDMSAPPRISDIELGCWYPKTFQKAIVVLVDALRYDFTIPFESTNASLSHEVPRAYHNALTILYNTSQEQPQNAFLLPLISDPPTTTYQALRVLTTGSLPTFIEILLSFDGAPVREDSWVGQLKLANKKVVHLGDELWTALFPDAFERDLSQSFESLNIWDLHTPDQGVTERLLPLLKEGKKDDWDVIVAHYLGVDHAGHRYGPDHPAMRERLRYVNDVINRVIAELQDDTLLVVLGDHGMDQKGDHGGESVDELTSAIWMYSKRGAFLQRKFLHAVSQLAFTPTFALLLGLPVPFGSLGQPIPEAFPSWEALTNVTRVTAGGIKRYHEIYHLARGLQDAVFPVNQHLEGLWEQAETCFLAARNSASAIEQDWKVCHDHFDTYQNAALDVLRGLWVRFDWTRMAAGICFLSIGILQLAYNIRASRPENEEETSLLQPQKAYKDLWWKPSDGLSSLKRMDYFVVSVGCFSVIMGLRTFFTYRTLPLHGRPVTPVSTSSTAKVFWICLSFLISFVHAASTASQALTVREDEVLWALLVVFGIAMGVASFRQVHPGRRYRGLRYSASFVLFSCIASYSRLCREDRVETCTSTYYGISSSSSTSAAWQLIFPLIAMFLIPYLIIPDVRYYTTMAKRDKRLVRLSWWSLQIGLTLVALLWTMESTDDPRVLKFLPSRLSRNLKTCVAQAIFLNASIVALAAIAYWLTHDDAPIVSKKDYARAEGISLPYYLVLVSTIPCVLATQKPMGIGALTIMIAQVLCLVELVNLLDMDHYTSSVVGACGVALLGSFYFFKTGHQAAMSAIQWDSAFIPFRSLHYPLSQVLVLLNTFGAQILAGLFLPMLPTSRHANFRKDGPYTALTYYTFHYVLLALTAALRATWAGIYKDHIGWFRVFNPRFMMGAAVMLTVNTFVAFSSIVYM
ncbi:hypothetical protein BDV96DRAFT_504831, partial [Lophiotrema nucula]